jgi:hypothetical protein
MAKLSTKDQLAIAFARNPYTSVIGTPVQYAKNPYIRDDSKWWNRIFQGIPYAYTSELYDQSDALRNDLRNSLSGDVLNYWDSLSETEQDALLENYYIKNENGLYNTFGLTGGTSTFDKDTFLKDIGEYSAIETAPLLSDYVDIDKALANAQASVDAENERLLASLNEELASTSDAYNNARNNLLAGQHQRNQMTVDTMASDMSRARRNAIEAGASAGIRIAGNVNSILSAQNKMSQQSLETSNQLAQMLVNQRNAEAGLRSQWRDIESSTYDRVQNRAQNEMNIGQHRYDRDYGAWQHKHDANVSESNALADSMLKHKTKSAYTNSGGSAY